MKPKIALVVALIVAIVSCRKVPDTSELSTEQVVATDRDPAAHFSNYSTYFISDSVSVVANDPKDSILTGPLAAQLVNAVKTNMNARGYTFKTPAQGLPDLGFRLTVIKDITRTAVCGGWWDGWWGWYPPCYWGYCGGFYYPWVD